MPLYKATVTILVLTAIGVASRRLGGDSQNELTTASSSFVPCPGCARNRARATLTSLELREIKIELIKQQILSKLRLRAPPRFNRSELPTILTHGEAISMSEARAAYDDRAEDPSMSDDYFGTTKNIVIFPENGTDNSSCHCSTHNSNPSNCFSFRLSQSKITESVADAELYIYKTASRPNNQTLVVSSTVHDRSCGTLRKRIIAIERDPPSSGWLRFDLGSTVRRWVTKPHLMHALEITCKGCSGGMVPLSLEERHRPFLVITTGPPSNPIRRKREVDCTESSSRCCKESFYLSFKEVGWDNWIIQPSGYSPNYCRGTCLSDISAMRYHHSTVLQKYIQNQRAKDGVSTVNLCCSASRMSSISMIYLDDDGFVIQKDLPNMVVEACDCT